MNRRMTPILLAIFIVMGLLALLSERSRVRSSAPQQKEVREPAVGPVAEVVP